MHYIIIIIIVFISLLIGILTYNIIKNSKGKTGATGPKGEMGPIGRSLPAPKCDYTGCGSPTFENITLNSKPYTIIDPKDSKGYYGTIHFSYSSDNSKDFDTFYDINFLWHKNTAEAKFFINPVTTSRAEARKKIIYINDNGDKMEWDPTSYNSFQISSNILIFGNNDLTFKFLKNGNNPPKIQVVGPEPNDVLLTNPSVRALVFYTIFYN
jgi:hypothetical protein